MINYIYVSAGIILLNMLSCTPDTEQGPTIESNITTNPELGESKNKKNKKKEKKDEENKEPISQETKQDKNITKKSENSKQKLYRETLINLKPKLEQKINDYAKELDAYKDYLSLKQFFANYNYTDRSINYDVPSDLTIEEKEKQLNADYLDKLKKYKLFITSMVNFRGLPVSTDDWSKYLKYEHLRDKLSKTEHIQKTLHWQRKLIVTKPMVITYKFALYRCVSFGTSANLSLFASKG